MSLVSVQPRCPLNTNINELSKYIKIKKSVEVEREPYPLIIMREKSKMTN